MVKLTVAQFSQKKGLSKKNIYKHIRNGEYRTEKSKVNNKEVLFILVDETNNFTPLSPAEPIETPSSPDINSAFTGNEPSINHAETPAEPHDNPIETPSLPAFSDEKETQKVIDFLMKQLEEKDRQIKEAQEENKKLLILLDQAQQLQAQNNYLLLDGKPLKEKQEERKPLTKEENEKREPLTKKNWFQRWLFGD